MNSRVLVQFATGPFYEQMVALTHDKHAAFAAKYNADFIVNREAKSTTWHGPERNINFRKLEIMIEMVEKYEKVLYLDADAVIVRDDFDIFNAAGYGIAFCAIWEDTRIVKTHINAGVCLINSSPEVKEFLHEWNKSPGNIAYKGETQWHDQAVMNLMMENRKWHDILTILPNRFNWCPDTQEARDPFIRAYHGKDRRLEQMQKFV
jgi:alpha-N-acetylglucosamine transferase